MSARTSLSRLGIAATLFAGTILGLGCSASRARPGAALLPNAVGAQNSEDACRRARALLDQEKQIEANEFRVEKYAFDNLNPFDRKESVIPRVTETSTRRLGLLESAAELCDHDAEVWYRLGRLRRLLGDHEQAGDAFAQCWSRACPQESAHRHAALRAALEMAWLLRDRGNTRQALAWTDRAAGLRAKAEELGILRALLSAELDSLAAAPEAEGAASAFTIERFGHGRIKMSLPARWAAALAHARRGEFALACNVLDGYPYALRHAPSYLRWYWHDYGTFCENLGRFEHAEECFEREWEAIPERFTLPVATWRGRRLILGIDGCHLPFAVNDDWQYTAGSRFAYAAQTILKIAEGPAAVAPGLAEAAVDQLMVCLRRGVRKAESRLLLGFCRLQSQQARPALMDLSAALEGGLPPTARAHAFALRGVVRYDLGELAAALDDLGRAVQEDSTLAYGWNALGACLAKAGRHEEAAAAFTAARRLNPKDPSAERNLELMRSRPQR